MSNKPTYDELAAHVAELKNAELRWYIERLRDAIDNFHYRGGDPYLREILKETPTQSINHIKAQIAKRQCSELAAQVEEETIERCAEVASVTYEGADYSDPTPIAFYERYSAIAINNMQRKYSNQPETAEKDGE